MYVAVKGGERAIANAHRLLAEVRRGDLRVAELSLAQIAEQLGLAVDRVMTEGSLYDRELAALAIKQAQGDLVEAIFLLRAYRTTLPRLGFSEPLDSERMLVKRRISAIFKDIPGGQVLGPTYDFTHRLLDFSLKGNGWSTAGRPADAAALADEVLPPDASMDLFAALQDREEIGTDSAAPIAASVLEMLRQEGLLEAEPADNGNQPVADLTRQPLQLPAGRDLRLQNLARADEGFLHALAYSALRGFGYGSHPFVGELRVGEVVVEVVPEELGFPIEIGQISITECFMLSRSGDPADASDTFTLGYGLTFGHCERKAMAMSLVDTCLQRAKQEGKVPAPAEDEEFVLYHSDNVEASGFVQHLKLPHYVDFQAELVRMRAERQKADQGEGPSPDGPRAAQR